jgi:hypothetical protein
MTEDQALIAVVALLVGAALIGRKYLPSGTRVVLSGTALAADVLLD